jgi:two-component system CheB/CheR fusion protein
MQTSQEELKSTNEELHTVNAELRANVNNLSQAGDDMKNLLDSTDIATLFLDAGLKVRRFTRQTTQLFKLIPGDVGRPIADLVTELEYPSLAANAREVLRSLLLHEQQVLTHSGAWFTVRIMPYRTQDNRIAGVVVTFVDISAAKALEASLREALAVLQSGSSDQPLEQEKAKVLESVLQQAKAFLGKR